MATKESVDGMPIQDEPELAKMRRAFREATAIMRLYRHTPCRNEDGLWDYPARKWLKEFHGKID